MEAAKKQIKEELVYLDANLIFGYAKQLARDHIDNKEKWRTGKSKDRKTQIKTDNILGNLKKCKFNFITSYLTNFEVIKNLKEQFGLTTEKAREILYKIIDEYDIIYCKEREINLDPAFFNLLLDVGIELKDGLHIIFARKPYGSQTLKLIIVTGDKKMYKARKIYPLIENPNDIIKKRLKEFKLRLCQ